MIDNIDFARFFLGVTKVTTKKGISGKHKKGVGLIKHPLKSVFPPPIKEGEN